MPIKVLCQLQIFTKQRLLLKVVQEYERAVIFRLGRLLSGGAKGPGGVVTLIMVLIVVLSEMLIFDHTCGSIEIVCLNLEVDLKL